MFGSGVARLCLSGVLLALAACEPSSADVQARGHVLQLSATPFQTATEVGYTAPGGSYVVRPQTDGRIFGLTKISVRNANAVLASLLIDERAMSAEDRLGHRYRIVNPWVQREASDHPIAKDGAFLPFLWGVSELKQGYNISGWVIFEIPADATVRGLIWDQVETIRLSFSDESG